MIKRILEEKIKSYLFRGKAIIVFGPRQAGKTTLIENILKNRSEKTLILNADDFDIREMLTKSSSIRLKSFVGNPNSFY